MLCVSYEDNICFMQLFIKKACTLLFAIPMISHLVNERRLELLVSSNKCKMCYISRDYCIFICDKFLSAVHFRGSDSYTLL